MDELRMTIRGMTCTHCVKTVRQQLEQVDGAAVERVEIGTATVRYDPAKVRPEQLLDAVADAGYEPAAAGAIDEGGAGA
jgi:copper chaperone CopZ